MFFFPMVVLQFSFIQRVPQADGSSDGLDVHHLLPLLVLDHCHRLGNCSMSQTLMLFGFFLRTSTQLEVDKKKNSVLREVVLKGARTLLPRFDFFGADLLHSLCKILARI